MGSSSTSEISIDTNRTSTMKTIDGFLKELSAIKDGVQRSTKVEEFLKRLEEERGKIEVFKRELPLCMHILNDAIEVLKQEIVKCEKNEKECKEKQSWMSSVQLWSDNSDHNDNESKSNDIKEKSKESDRITKEIKHPDCNYFNGRGAFMPFKGISGFSMITRKTEKVVVQLPDLSLMPHGISHSVNGGSMRTLLPSPMPAVRPNLLSTIPSNSQSFQSPRKERRCWSPELHRRFVHALQQLGGSQVATPKQIRDMMKVDGLTNDEVKSHLQKYRLHTRRDPANQQVMMMGGVWAPHDLTDISKQSNSESSSPQGPLQLAGTTRGISLTGGESCEDDDWKSEGHSWKGQIQKDSEE